MTKKRNKRFLIEGTCQRCNKIFSFQKERRTGTFCSLECRNKRNDVKHPLYPFFCLKIDRVRNNSKRRKIPFNINANDLINIFEKQNGKCYYTGLELHTDIIDWNDYLDGYPFQLSIDRIDSKKGYETNNIVLCCWALNNFKGSANINDIRIIFDKIYENEGKIYGERNTKS